MTTIDCNADLDHPCDADDGEPCPRCAENEAEWRRYFAGGRKDFVCRRMSAAEERELDAALVDAGRGHLVSWR